MWGITATPLQKLQTTLYRILRADDICRGWTEQQKKSTVDMTMVNKLKSLIIRHTKKQIIAGRAALSLPSMPVSTLSVNLSAAELANYKQYRNYAAVCLRMLTTKKAYYPASYIDRMLAWLRQATNQESKFIALFASIRNLLSEVKHAKVVVFSRYKNSIEYLLLMLGKPGSGLSHVPVTQIHGNVAVKLCQKAIRAFQNPSNTQPGILIVSYITGEWNHPHSCVQGLPP